MFNKCLRFSLRKYKVGLASVAVGAFFLLSGGAVSADELDNSEASLTEIASPEALPYPSNALPRPTNEGELIPNGTTLRSAEVASEEEAIPDGYGQNEPTFPEELEKYRDTNPNRLTYGLLRHVDGNIITHSYDKLTNTLHITEFTEAGEVVKTIATPSVAPDKPIILPEKFVGGNVTIEVSKRAVSNNESPITVKTIVASPKVAYTIFQEGSRDNGLAATNNISLYAPVKVDATVEHINKLTNEKIHKDIIIQGYTGDGYTTRPLNKAGEVGAPFDVVEPSNKEGIFNTSSWKNGVVSEAVFNDRAYNIYENGKVVTKRGQYITKYQVLNDEGDMLISATMDGVPLKAMEYTGRDTVEQYPKKIYRWTGGYEMLVKPSYAPEGPYRAVFEQGNGTTEYYRNKKDGDPNKIGPEDYLPSATVRNPYRNASSRITYYYTQEIAEVLIKDVTNGENNVLETITGISGKGESEITKELVKAQTAKDVDAILAGYLGDYYKLVDNGDDFANNPTFNAQTIDVGPTDTPEESMAREKARREANKKIIEIRLEKLGSVVVNYVDSNGTVLQPSVTDTNKEAMGTDYDTSEHKKATIEANGKTYFLVENKTAEAKEDGSFTVTDGGPVEAGQVAFGKTNVTYVYQEAGSVVVNYVDDKGNEIKPSEVDTDKKAPGTAYDTSEFKKETIEVNGKTYILVPEKTAEVGEDGSFTVTDGAPVETGEVKSGKTNVTYIYQEAGSVVVNFVDDKGNEIKPSEVDTDKKAPGTAYDTSEFKKETIEANGKTYILVPEKTAEANEDGSFTVTDGAPVETGEVKSGKTNVTYVYKEKVAIEQEADLTFKLEESGEVKPFLNVPVLEATGKEGSKISFDGYQEKLAELLANGYEVVTDDFNNDKTFDADSSAKQHYQVVLRKKASDNNTPDVPADSVKKGSIVVNYVDTEGNVIQSPVVDTDNAPISENYTTTDNKPSALQIGSDRYVLVPSLTKGSEEGQVTEGKTEVTYVYKKVANWIPLIPGEANPPMTSYPFDPENPDKPVEPITEDSTKPNNPPVVPYVEGYEALDPVTNMPLKPKNPNNLQEGYISPVPGNSGENTYIPYRPVSVDGGNQNTDEKKGEVIVHYKDEVGNTLTSSVALLSQASVGTDYSTLNNKPEVLTIDGVRYVLVPSLTEGEEQGQVKEGKTEVTYVYKKVANWIPLIPGEANPPMTSYPFDSANPDKPVESITEDNTKPNNPPVVPYVEGYEALDPVTNMPLKPKNPNNLQEGYIPPVPRDSGENTYIPYAPVVGSVIVSYVDVDGNVLKPSVSVLSEAKAGTDYDTSANKPKELVLADGTRYVLVENRTEGSEIGKVVKGETKVTYVYQKVSSPSVASSGGSTWIPTKEEGSKENNGTSTTETSTPSDKPNTEVTTDVAVSEKETPSVSATTEAKSAEKTSHAKMADKALPKTGKTQDATGLNLALLMSALGFGVLSRRKEENE